MQVGQKCNLEAMRRSKNTPPIFSIHKYISQRIHQAFRAAATSGSSSALLKVHRDTRRETGNGKLQPHGKEINGTSRNIKGLN